MLFATITSAYNNEPHKLNTPRTETCNRPRSHSSRILRTFFPKTQLNVLCRSPCSSKWPLSIPVLCAFLDRTAPTLCPPQTAVSSLPTEPPIHVNTTDRSFFYHDPQLLRSTFHRHKTSHYVVPQNYAPTSCLSRRHAN